MAGTEGTVDMEKDTAMTRRKITATLKMTTININIINTKLEKNHA